MMEEWHELAASTGLIPITEVPPGRKALAGIIEDPTRSWGAIRLPSHNESVTPVEFARLAQQLLQICRYSSEELYRIHLSMSRHDLVLHIERPIYPLPSHQPEDWQPGEVPALLDSLPRNEPLALYGRGPAWLFAALAMLTIPEDCEVFDGCQGWVTVPSLQPEPTARPGRVGWQHAETRGRQRLQLEQTTFLDARDAAGMPIPAVATDKGLLLSGDLPAWLWAAFARAYQQQRWLAIQNQQRRPGVIVHSQDAQHPIGSVIAE